MNLEANCGLNPSLEAHVWLLHYLFLDSINDDALEWAESWNLHKLKVRGEPEASPRERFLFGMLENGPRGLEALREISDEVVDNPNDYGIDWAVHEDEAVMSHLLEENAEEWEEENPFAAATNPARMAHIEVLPPNCPFSREELDDLDAHLADHINMQSRDMSVRLLVWECALNFCHDLYIANPEG